MYKYVAMYKYIIINIYVCSFMFLCKCVCVHGLYVQLCLHVHIELSFLFELPQSRQQFFSIR